MKPLLLFLLLAIISVSSIPAQDAKPVKSLSFVFNEFHQKDTLKFVECTLRNNTDSIFWILAYDTSHTKKGIVIRPVFMVKEKKEGKWKLTDLGFSGVGLEAFQFSPGEQIILETPDFDPASDAIRIGIEMRRPSRDEVLRPVREIWTDEIKLH